MASAADAYADARQPPENRTRDAEFWRRAWRNPAVPGAFSNPSYFLKGLRRWEPARNRLPVSLAQLKSALSRDAVFQTARTLRRRFERRADVTLYFNERWEADLGDYGHRLRRLTDDASSARYFLLCVDLFSKKFFVEAVKNKTAAATADAWDRIVARLAPPYAPPAVLETDQGGEFRGDFARRVTASGVVLKTARGVNKARCAERGIRSFKKILTPLVENAQRHFPTAVAAAETVINARFNRALGCAPNDVPDQWRRVRALHIKRLARPPWKEYAKRQRHLWRGGGVRERGRVWKIGDLVRAPLARDTMGKESDRQLRYQIFRVAAIATDSEPYLYALEEWLGDEENVASRRKTKSERLPRYYYAAELRPAYPSDWYPIERVRRRSRGQALVSFLDHPPKFDRWLPARHVRWRDRL